MKYKVGDRVKVRQDLKVDKKYGKVTFISNMVEFTSVTIKEVYEHAYGVEENDWRYTDEMLDGKDYSKVTHLEYVEKKREMLRDLGSESGTCDGTDCKKCPFFAVKNSKNISCYEFEREHPLEAIKLIMGYECKKPILNDGEKEFLRGVIKAYQTNVALLRKFENHYAGDVLQLYIGEGIFNTLVCGEKFKGMEPTESYTPEELGLC